jgi:hypothetical protein
MLPSEGPPEPPAQIDAPLEEPKSTSPAADDDPFKDEPSKPNDAPAPAPPKPGVGRRPPEKNLGKRETIRWRVTAKSPSGFGQNSQFKPTGSAEEPQRLQSVESVGDVDRIALPVSTAKSNPLRSSSPKARVDRVMPTANWSAEQPAVDAPAGTWRANPLRSN